VNACGIPTTAQAISVNATVTQLTAAGDLRLFAGGTAAPLSTTIKYRAGQTRANNAIVSLGAAGGVEESRFSAIRRSARCISSWTSAATSKPPGREEPTPDTEAAIPRQSRRT
jgi:hypothetical protein